jgi:hypothetical protein
LGYNTRRKTSALLKSLCFLAINYSYHTASKARRVYWPHPRALHTLGSAVSKYIIPWKMCGN